MRNYKNLGVWQNADELTFQVYQVTRHFPAEEMYGIIPVLNPNMSLQTGQECPVYRG